MMRKFNTIIFISIFLLNMYNLTGQTKNYPVDSFDKVVISPHIQVNFIKGNKEEVTIESISVSHDKFNVEVSGKTLHLYLDDAKTVTKSEKVENEDGNRKQSIYDGTIVKATITYKSIDDLSLRGDENFECKSAFDQDKLVIKIYGEATVVINEVKLNSLTTTIYGESNLVVKKGNIKKHKITAYGESEVNTIAAISESVKVIAYGEGEIRIHATDDLKVTAYGEADIKYKGDPKVSKGIVIGEASIDQIN